MPEDQGGPEPKTRRMKRAPAGGAMGAGYGLGFIGALIYYIQTATSFGMGLLGVLKALFWPAFLVYLLLRHLGA